MIDRREQRWVLVLLALFGGASHSQQTQSDWVIVPGERVGPVTAQTSEEAIVTFFGPNNVRGVDVYLGEGFTVPGTVVYPDDATKRIEVVWSDDARTIPKEVRLTGDSSEWHTADGLSLGSTLRDIERLNGFPFELAGFAFDYAGTVVDCERGRLSALGCGGGAIRLVVVRLNPDDEARGKPEYRQVVGDRVFSSGHPAMQSLNPRVYQMIVSLSHEDPYRRQ